MIDDSRWIPQEGVGRFGWSKVRQRWDGICPPVLLQGSSISVGAHQEKGS